ncbi:MAG: chemotaxis protein CheA [Clostridia bacterium]|nr:chemotaxis protein CheA [Clostridia bacterium]
MSNNAGREPMLDMFIFETFQLIEQLEQVVLNSEKSDSFDSNSINEIFRIMHTIKGSSAMMLYNDISKLAHSIEDLFYYIREKKPQNVDFSALSDIVLEGVDFIKNEVTKLEEGNSADGSSSEMIESIKNFLSALKAINSDAQESAESERKKSDDKKDQKYYISSYQPADDCKTNLFRARIFFEDGCEMENIRAFSVVHSLKEKTEVLEYTPEDIMENDNSTDIIIQEGFEIVFRTALNEEAVRDLLMQTIFLRDLELVLLQGADNSQTAMEGNKKRIVLEDEPAPGAVKQTDTDSSAAHKTSSAKQSMISVNLLKLDKLMDLVGELVISEAMVTRNPEIMNLQLDSFHKAARQLRKITSEIQDMVMEIRMVPISMTLQKMNRIVRDMSKKLKKDVQLEIIGEETEVDKNIIEQISDPLMHLIRNSIDHGIETTEERVAKGKPAAGKITLEAKNAGGDVWIIVKDDGKGLDKEKILQKAKENGLVRKPESELTDKEIYSFILLPGFSTKEKVTEFSGRGVGMDVVVQNIEKIGGSVLIDSAPGMGSVFSIKIPLTLAIIDGMVISVGNSTYTVPTTSIKESFRPKPGDVITDPDGNEMILIRGECYPVLRLHRAFNVKTKIEEFHEGVIMMVENDDKGLCIFADALLGEQQVVVKALPKYIKKVKGLAGCTLLGDGSISLIMDVAGLIENY